MFHGILPIEFVVCKITDCQGLHSSGFISTVVPTEEDFRQVRRQEPNVYYKYKCSTRGRHTRIPDLRTHGGF